MDIKFHIIFIIFIFVFVNLDSHELKGMNKKDRNHCLHHEDRDKKINLKKENPAIQESQENEDMDGDRGD